ncbi:hypothetical protein LTR07_005972 [Exophiala xenobiotica]|nr:hypothetical protein LTR79_001589 [Exophiala xenobiotica]KAK5408999.1 hypothetical protein LTR90_009122 [Exophiala xenobiotica]KAK5488840.1 hypothetical protein LTR26_004156 [Exophiala xenobiotica]KAK5506709.1 hypothetical protein LTR83_001262 [Exophiala xenobiotica]KAK5519002.1 hypothetical protein LTR07_005972 [Exophiala xenobiotica]
MDRFLRLVRGIRSSRYLQKPLRCSEPSGPVDEATEHAPVHHRNPFLELPAELLLTITDFLDKEYQVLLSLSCKRLRVLLNSRLDLSLHDMSIKLRFLQHLEHDYPEHLTCRTCGFLYSWKQSQRVTRKLGCPRSRDHPLDVSLASDAWHTLVGTLTVSRQVVELIFRGLERGPQHGLPLSYLSKSSTDPNGNIIRTNEARLVDGQLLLASRWETEIDSNSDSSRERNKAERFNKALTWQPIEQAVASMTGSELVTASKCPFCATDYSLHVRNGTGGRTTILLNVWRNYGRAGETTLESEQMFINLPCSPIDAVAFSERNLQAIFESHEETLTE